MEVTAYKYFVTYAARTLEGTPEFGNAFVNRTVQIDVQNAEATIPIIEMQLRNHSNVATLKILSWKYIGEYVATVPDTEPVEEPPAPEEPVTRNDS